ncbi:hypothetical protein BDD12DRAFT_859285 [Trichophaea hybrida]|nr:hypothetical protein BDD12DRAFT_859285 [Trichophaea hybrida]
MTIPKQLLKPFSGFLPKRAVLILPMPSQVLFVISRVEPRAVHNLSLGNVPTSQHRVQSSPASRACQPGRVR